MRIMNVLPSKVLLAISILIVSGAEEISRYQVSKTTTTTTPSSPPPRYPPTPTQWQQQRHHNDPVAMFFQDLNKLNELYGKLPVLSQSHAHYDSSYTKSWNEEDWSRHQIRSFHRYKRHMISWFTSTTAKAVTPSVAVVVLWSIVIELLHQKIGILREIFSKSSLSSGVSAFTAPIGLLLALRTNRALNRLLEARSMFGKIIRLTSSLAGLGCTYLSKNDDAILMGRYLSIYGWAVKSCFRGNETMDKVCQTMLPPNEAAWICSSPADVPTSIVFRLRQLIARSKTPIPMEIAAAMERYICELESCLGVCKRLTASPIPPTFSRHTSRALCLYLGLLPVTLVATGSSLISILVSVTLLSYVFIGIDEISVEIENPFPLIPMFQLGRILQKNIQNQFEMMTSSSKMMATP